MFLYRRRRYTVCSKKATAGGNRYNLKNFGEFAFKSVEADGNMYFSASKDHVVAFVASTKAKLEAAAKRAAAAESKRRKIQKTPKAQHPDEPPKGPPEEPPKGGGGRPRSRRGECGAARGAVGGPRIKI